MSRIGQKPSTAQQRDAELARVEAELKAAREQLVAVNGEIGRSCALLANLQHAADGGNLLPRYFGREAVGSVAPAGADDAKRADQTRRN